MGVMRVDHPDILDFISSKKNEGTIKNFNISVALTDEFMRDALNPKKRKVPWHCFFKGKEYPIHKVNRNSEGIVLSIESVIPAPSAHDLLEEIADHGWKNGEPGYIFIDEVNKKNPLPGLGDIKACNPCVRTQHNTAQSSIYHNFLTLNFFSQKNKKGEQFLHDSDVCNLGALNLESFAVYYVRDREFKFNWKRFDKVISIAVNMLDNVIDLTECDVESVQQMMRNVRRIGLGVMGFARLLFLLKIPYDSGEARTLGSKIMKRITTVAGKTSRKLGLWKGSFPFIDKSIHKAPRRNCATTTVAPTGTTAMLADTSGGLEPEFALAYKYRGVLGSVENGPIYNMNPIVVDYMNSLYREYHVITSQEQLKEIMASVSKFGGFKKFIDSDKKKWGFLSEPVAHFVTAMEISPTDHLLMQAAFQKHCDNSISKTINLPNEATRDDVRNVIIRAWKSKCKGCTVYRDGSRNIQVLNVGVVSGRKSKKKRKLIAPPSSPNLSSSSSSPPVRQKDIISKDDLAKFKLQLSMLSSASPLPTENEEGKNSLLCFSDLDDEYDSPSPPSTPPPPPDISPQTKKRIRDQYENAARELYTEKLCPDCRILLVHTEGCSECKQCGFSLCSS